MRVEGRAGALRELQGLQGGGGFGVGERQSAETHQAHPKGDQKCERVQPAFVFEMSVRHGGYCNLFVLRRMPDSSGFKKRDLLSFRACKEVPISSFCFVAIAIVFSIFDTL